MNEGSVAMSETTLPQPVRNDPPVGADERAMLESWLEFHRATLLTKLDGLGERELRTRSVPPSGLSLLGLVRHLTTVERNWFRLAYEAGSVAAEDPDQPVEDAFDGVDQADVARDLASYREEVDHSRRVGGRQQSLDSTGTGIRGGRRIAPTLRWIYVHMIEEYARHNGHADLLRERIDGVVGV
ncbi:DinB family protein [Actinopolymorpha pittospori]|uniref:Damage-inducible protein DinB n=1 Tax=Actinopolymorpha pittospori TaxID=648752 RepID=A0A927MR16_9ACTN|nr:DinB family protein [Actinopolymorpha pittospori]MBE1604657.1 putative damage-inducible protein DinB [Actinopolymorpha pittospori]